MNKCFSQDEEYQIADLGNYESDQFNKDGQEDEEKSSNSYGCSEANIYSLDTFDYSFATAKHKSLSEQELSQDLQKEIQEISYAELKGSQYYQQQFKENILWIFVDKEDTIMNKKVIKENKQYSYSIWNYLYQKNEQVLTTRIHKIKLENNNIDNINDDKRQLIIHSEQGIHDFYSIRKLISAFNELADPTFEQQQRDEQVNSFLGQSYNKLLIKLNCMHNLGIAHGDVRPQNMIIDLKCEPYFIDFDAAVYMQGDYERYMQEYTPFYNISFVKELRKEKNKISTLLNYCKDIAYQIDRIQFYLSFIYILCQTKETELYFINESFEKIEQHLIEQNKYTFGIQLINLLKQEESNLIQRVELIQLQIMQDDQQGIKYIDRQNIIARVPCDEQQLFTNEVILHSSKQSLIPITNETECLFHLNQKQYQQQQQQQQKEIKFNDNDVNCYFQNEKHISDNDFMYFLIGIKMSKNKEEIEVIALNRIISVYLNHMCAQQIQIEFNNYFSVTDFINLHSNKLQNLNRLIRKRIQQVKSKKEGLVLFYIKQLFEEQNNKYLMISNQELNSFTQVLQLYPEIASLKIKIDKNQNINPKFISNLVEKLEQLPHLQTLSLSLINQEITTFHQIISNLFKKCKQLSLKLSSIQQQTNPSFQPFQPSKNDYPLLLQKLSLQIISSQIDDSYLIYLIEVLKLTKIEELILDLSLSASITDQGISTLISTFSSFKYLKTLNLNFSSCSNFSFQSINSFKEILQSKIQMCILNISDCKELSLKIFSELLDFFIHSEKKISKVVHIIFYFISQNKEIQNKIEQINLKFKENISIYERQSNSKYQIFTKKSEKIANHSIKQQEEQIDETEKQDEKEEQKELEFINIQYKRNEQNKI